MKSSHASIWRKRSKVAMMHPSEPPLERPTAMEVLARVSQHPGHDPTDPRVLMVEDMAADQCSLCSEGVHRWRSPDGQFAHTCATFHGGDECAAHNTLRIAVEHGVPIYTGAELEFPEPEDTE